MKQNMAENSPASRKRKLDAAIQNINMNGSNGKDNPYLQHLPAHERSSNGYPDPLNGFIAHRTTAAQAQQAEVGSMMKRMSR